MKWRDIIRKSEWVLIPLILVAAAFFGGSHYGARLTEQRILASRDTVTRVVTVYKDFPQPQKAAIFGTLAVPRYKFLSDTVKAVETLVLHDTAFIYLPREQKYYEEDSARVRIWVSGYEPRLDRYEVDRQERIITQTTERRVPARWGLGLSAGYGLALADGRRVVASPYLGVGLTYNIVSW